MFIPKPNSNQKHVKKTQERETGSLSLNSSLGELKYSLWRARNWTTRQASKVTRQGELKQVALGN